MTDQAGSPISSCIPTTCRARAPFIESCLVGGQSACGCRSGTYNGLGLGGAVDGGIVECDARRPIWLPYVEVHEIEAVAERGRALGAAVLLEPREGPAGWRSVLASRDGGEIALWQPKVASCEGPDD